MELLNWILRIQEWDPTFRYIFENQPINSPDNSIEQNKEPNQGLTNLIQNLSKEVKELKATVTKLNSTESTTNTPNTKVAIFNKSKGIQSTDTCAALINSSLANNITIQPNEIDSIHDFSDKKGPIIVSFKSVSTKIAVLKNHIRSGNLAINDYLSKDKLVLFAKLKMLTKKNVVKKCWIYKGDIYYCLRGERTLATRDEVNHLLVDNGFSDPI